ncbi:Uncharacterised protein [Mycolicibacterium aichiense]|nr:Uncharacterised protein [Mycolicibacterium aichiense]
MKFRDQATLTDIGKVLSTYIVDPSQPLATFTE